MNCSNCAAAMELVESRRYFRCHHCGTFRFPETVEADAIRVVGTAAASRKCPVCQAGMAHALIDESHPIDFCIKCRGALVPRPTFAGVVNKRRAWAIDPPAEPIPLDREALSRELLCPRCSGPFDTYPHYGPGNVVIDSCTRCDLVWLDFGEMRQMVDAPGSERGSRHMPRIDEEYVRSGWSSKNVEDLGHHRRRDPLGRLIEALFED